MGYCDHTDAEIRALTRQRRDEARLRRLAALAQPLRFSGGSVEFRREISGAGAVVRSKSAATSFRRRMWKAGVRACFYCQGLMTGNIGKPSKCTVDHREPLSRGGADHESNWVLACLSCNGAKADMTEAEFRAVVGSRKAA